MNKIKSGFTNVSLDLHGVRHMDVKQQVISFIENHWDTGEELHIITGNSIKMKELVVIVLEEYKLEYKTNYGKILTYT